MFHRASGRAKPLPNNSVTIREWVMVNEINQFGLFRNQNMIN
jgi:hypothetical protein